MEISTSVCSSGGLPDWAEALIESRKTNTVTARSQPVNRPIIALLPWTRITAPVVGQIVQLLDELE